MRALTTFPGIGNGTGLLHSKKGNIVLTHPSFYLLSLVDNCCTAYIQGGNEERIGVAEVWGWEVPRFLSLVRASPDSAVGVGVGGGEVFGLTVELAFVSAHGRPALPPSGHGLRGANTSRSIRPNQEWFRV